MKYFLLTIVISLIHCLVFGHAKVENCDSLKPKLFFHGMETCLKNGDDIFKCGLILTQRNISPAIYYYHYRQSKNIENDWVLINESVYYPNNINFINNLIFNFHGNFMELTFTTYAGEKKHWKLPISKKFNLRKKFKRIEDSLSKELSKFED